MVVEVAEQVLLVVELAVEAGVVVTVVETHTQQKPVHDPILYEGSV